MNSIGYFEEEKNAVRNVKLLLYGSLAYILALSCPLEIITFYLYNQKNHPFRNILTDIKFEGKQQATKMVQTI